MRQTPRALEQWEQCKALVIDEVSMCLHVCEDCAHVHPHMHAHVHMIMCMCMCIRHPKPNPNPTRARVQVCMLDGDVFDKIEEMARILLKVRPMWTP